MLSVRSIKFDGACIDSAHKKRAHPGKTRRCENDASQSNQVHMDIDILPGWGVPMRRQRVMVEGFVFNEGLNLYR